MNPSLAVLVALDAAALFALSLARALGGEGVAHSLIGEPGARVVGALLVALGWLVLRVAPARATGARRWLSRLAAGAVVLAGLAHLGGPPALSLVDALVPLGSLPGARALVGALSLAAVAVFLHRTSPLRRAVTRVKDPSW